ncbi:hypothetical protein AGOR_G00187700 [Albula goreensis]|uniref:Ig-like domain-containing protein n=1 Tax=Albula goreensis TaxID=1534307 RepID=A0A8T3CYT4_9TELE|nr:hypothetical protein AGOR_G00187700 [Albula goreensis]
MRSLLGKLHMCLFLLGAIGVGVDTEFVEPPPSFSLRSLAEGSTRLPCLFQVQDEDQVVQVTWNREKPDGTKEPIITAHRTEGHTEFGRFSGRVQFENSDPMRNAALIIRSTEVSDEGTFICHISTFPSGNFERQLFLSVWTTPISSLDPAEMVEGQSYRVAATCRSVARPPPYLSWDTDLPGQSQNRSSEGGAVSTYFSLHPLRSMNGKRLDCLVWHSSLEKPRRITNRLVVHFPPDAAVRGYDGNWFVGLEGVSLMCDSGGNPKPQTFTWSRRGQTLPDSVSVKNNTLQFEQPLAVTDSGIYECVAQNSVGTSKAEVEISVSARQETPFSSLLMIIVGVVAGVLVVAMVISVIMVNRYHKSRNRKLEMELTEKREEISTLSRQASIRRVNSVSTDHRMQMEETAPLRVEATLRTSLSSLGEQGRCRDSRSTLSGGRGGGGGAVDFLGRPALYNSSRKGERGREREMEREGEKVESRQRVESFIRNSSMSLDRPLHAPLHPSLPMSLRNHLPPYSPAHSPLPTYSPAHSPLPADEEERETEQQRETQKQAVEVDGYSENSSQISEGLSPPLQQANGTLYPKNHSQLLLPPANSILPHHKGQIV